MSELAFDATGYLDMKACLAAFKAGKPDVAKCKGALRNRWLDLQAPPVTLTGRALGAWKAKRGYELERILILLADLEGLEPHPPFRPSGKGEQIDGFLVLDHRAFLIETKWQASAGIADVFAFQGKLRGKLNGTLGLFVSVGGFAETVATALTHGRVIDVLLADREDVRLALDPAHSLSAVLRVKLREAARTGAVYYGYQRWLDEQGS